MAVPDSVVVAPRRTYEYERIPFVGSTVSNSISNAPPVRMPPSFAPIGSKIVGSHVIKTSKPVISSASGLSRQKSMVKYSPAVRSVLLGGSSVRLGGTLVFVGVFVRVAVFVKVGVSVGVSVIVGVFVIVDVFVKVGVSVIVGEGVA